MATGEFTGTTLSANASGDVAANRFVKMATTANETLLVIECTDGQQAIGISTHAAADGEAVGVAVDGVGMLYVNAANANIAAMSLLNCIANDGVGGVEASDGQPYNAIALEPSTADGDKIRVLIVNAMRGA